jgi:hypothetical protein
VLKGLLNAVSAEVGGARRREGRFAVIHQKLQAARTARLRYPLEGSGALVPVVRLA